ncbi:MAG: HAMP domain-containing histidine kinase, partial [Clostridia bacterium]|nr:HAMP domain-containing histidine kinase [Clostridia bacterium]
LQHDIDPLQGLSRVESSSDVTTAPETDGTAATEAIENQTWVDYQYYNHFDYAILDDIDNQNLTFFASLNGKTSQTETLELHSCGGIAVTGGELYIIAPDAAPADSKQVEIPGTGLRGTSYEDNRQLAEYLREIGFDSSSLNPELTAVILPNDVLLRGSGFLGGGNEDAFVMGLVFWGIVSLAALIIILFIGVIIDHRSYAQAERGIGRLLGHIWIELRLAILFFAVCVYIMIISETSEMFAYTFLISTAWFWLHLICADLRTNRMRTFSCNIFTTVTRAIQHRREQLPLHRALSRRSWLWLFPAFLCGIFALLTFFLALNPFGGFLPFLFLMSSAYFVGGMLIFLALNEKTRREDMADVAALAERIQAIHSGKAGEPLHLSERSIVAPYASALEDLQAGIELAVAERTRSERTKIEMVTNISHDLKTPLTSIVGYTDLLAGVEGLPPEAADYVAVITRKSARLNALIKDLFALSKATTYDLPLQPEPMDLARLLNQLLAEQTDAIAASALTLVTSLPDHECAIFNDGTKLYRVFANLLENALRYSLDGSRVFLTLSDAVASDGVPVWRVIVKNTSREYIDFTADEILTRFVRGDKSRTSDGSGLGLPIAKSFTELCGGRFNLNLDGDLFTVIIDLPKSGLPQH